MRIFAPSLVPTLIVGLFAIGTAPAFAQVRTATLEELRRELSPGDSISLVQTTGEPISGRLVRVDDTALEIRTEVRHETGKQRLDITVPLSTIRSLERPRDSLRNGIGMGAGVGAGVTLGMFIHAAAVDYNEIDEWAPMYLAMGAVAAGVGAAVGWAIDAARSKPNLRFDAAAPGALKIQVAPLVARRKGMSVAVSF